MTRFCDQVVPRHFSGNRVVLAIPMRQEQASLEDLDEDCPSDPLTDVSEILDGCNSLCSQLCPLIEILERQLVQDMLFASQEPQEVEVSPGASADDAARCRLERCPCISAIHLRRARGPLDQGEKRRSPSNESR